LVIAPDTTPVSPAEEKEEAWFAEFWRRVGCAFERATGQRWSGGDSDDPTANAFALGALSALDALRGSAPDVLSWELEVGRRKLSANRRAARAGGVLRKEGSASKIERTKKVAVAYRRNDPDATARKMERDLAERMGIPLGTVRDRLRKLGIK
jgi:hypothetical protein